MYIPRSLIVVSHDSSIFNFFRNLHTVFHSGYTLHTYQQCTSVPSSPLSCPHLFAVALIKAITTSVRWCLIVVSNCLISDAEHSFRHLDICMSSLEKYPFLKWFLFLLVWFQFQGVGGFLFAFAIELASLVAQLVMNLPAMRETWVQSLGWEDPLEKGKAIHSSILAWRIPWTV